MHLHKWTKWEVIQYGDLLGNFSKELKGGYIIQQKVCEKCGKIKLKSVVSWY
jgi:hypothetical protein